jgi:hypothetical protein
MSSRNLALDPKSDLFHCLRSLWDDNGQFLLRWELSTHKREDTTVLMTAANKLVHGYAKSAANSGSDREGDYVAEMFTPPASPSEQYVLLHNGSFLSDPTEDVAEIFPSPSCRGLVAFPSLRPSYSPRSADSTGSG